MPPATISFRASSAALAMASSGCATGTANSLSFCLDHSGTFVILFMLLCIGSAPIATVLGRDFFPSVDAGLIRLHMRARVGQRVEETARECDEVENLVRRVIPPEDLGNILDNIGLPNSSLNMTYSNSGDDWRHPMRKS